MISSKLEGSSPMRFSNKSIICSNASFAAVSSNPVTPLSMYFLITSIYSYLSQSFAEKLEQEKGTETMSATMSEIKEQIIDDIKTGKNGRSVTAVDWSSEDGKSFIKTEFNRILYILAKNED